MACNSPLNLSGKTWAQPNHTKVIERVDNSKPELLAVAITETEGIPAVYPDLLLQGTVRQVFESDGMQVVITFAKGTNFKAGFRSEPVSRAVQALVVPFRWEDLVARVGSVLRHSITHTNSNATRFGDVCVDFSSMEVSRSSGEQVALTAQEFKTLKFFVLNPGRVISRDELLNQAWGYDNYPCSRTVDNHVLKLRQKLEKEPSRPKHFLTVHSVGYKFLP